jgi:hypothetical protein
LKIHSLPIPHCGYILGIYRSPPTNLDYKVYFPFILRHNLVNAQWKYLSIFAYTHHDSRLGRLRARAQHGIITTHETIQTKSDHKISNDFDKVFSTHYIEKLTDSNYCSWSIKIKTIFRAKQLLSIVNGTKVAPSISEDDARYAQRFPRRTKSSKL